VKLQRCFQRVALGVFDRVDGQIDVEVGPVKMVWLGPVESEDRLVWGALEPRVLIEGQEQLSLVEQQPEAVPGDVGYFSLRSGSSRHMRIFA
jgi:hypothetical protein